MKYICAACNKSVDLKNLFIITVKNNGEISLLDTVRENSQNIFVCRNPECLSILFKKGILNNADKKLRNKFLKELKMNTSDGSKTEKFLGMGIKSGKIIRGFTSVVSSIKKDEVKLIVISRIQKENTRKKLNALVKKTRIEIFEYRGKREFDRVVGKPNCTCVGVKDKTYADLIKKELNEIYDTHSS